MHAMRLRDVDVVFNVSKKAELSVGRADWKWFEDERVRIPPG